MLCYNDSFLSLCFVCFNSIFAAGSMISLPFVPGDSASAPPRYWYIWATVCCVSVGSGSVDVLLVLATLRRSVCLCLLCVGRVVLDAPTGHRATVFLFGGSSFSSLLSVSPCDSLFLLVTSIYIYGNPSA